MANSRTLVVFSATVILLLACACSFVHGSETLPWGVYRVRSPCGWDNNGDLVVDEEANAGQYTRIAVIDSGIDYYEDREGIHYHPDLAVNVVGGNGCKYVESGDYVEVRPDHEDPDYGDGPWNPCYRNNRRSR